MWIRIISIAIVFGLTGLAIVVLSVGPPSRGAIDDLENEGESIGAVQKGNRYGGWNYALEDDARSFSLSIGEYEKDLFTLYWVSAEQEWFLDT